MEEPQDDVDELTAGCGGYKQLGIEGDSDEAHWVRYDAGDIGWDGRVCGGQREGADEYGDGCEEGDTEDAAHRPQ